MPQFRYKAIGANGQAVEGALDAPTENDLIVRLSSQGLRIQSISRVPLGSAAQPVQRAPAAVQTAQPPRTAPAVRATAPSAVVRTKRASRMDLHFTFANMNNLFRAGFGAAQVFEELSRRATKEHLRQSFADAARHSTEGTSIADSLARYPDIFPEGAEGAVRAGEAGGYLPDACADLATRFRDDHLLAWQFRLMRWLLVSFAVCLPLGFALTQAMDRTIHYILTSNEDAGTFSERLAVLRNFFGGALLGGAGVALVLIIVGYLVTAHTLRKTEWRARRHAWTLKVPLIQRYAKNECIESLAWHLGRLSSAGIAPNRAWQLAASAVPNIAFGQAALAASPGTSENIRTSDLLYQSQLFPPDHVSLVQTGEMAGSLPQALDQSAALAQAEKKHARAPILVAIMLFTVLLSGALTVVIAAKFYTGYFNAVFREAENVSNVD